MTDRKQYLRDWRAANRERLLSYDRQRDKSPERRAQNDRSRLKHREKRLAEKKAYREANPAKVAAGLRRWRQEHPEAGVENAREWRKANPERYRQNNRNHKARRKGASGSHSAADIRDILRLQKRRCAICRCRLGKVYHVDHIVALAAGGSNDRSNLQIACQDCNLAKGARDPIDFMQSLGRLL